MSGEEERLSETLEEIALARRRHRDTIIARIWVCALIGFAACVGLDRLIPDPTTGARPIIPIYVLFVPVAIVRATLGLHAAWISAIALTAASLLIFSGWGPSWGVGIGISLASRRPIYSSGGGVTARRSLSSRIVAMAFSTVSPPATRRTRTS